MLGTRGTSQIDWVFSLGFFLLYLSVFFIFVQQNVLPPQNAETVISQVETGILRDATSNVNRLPLIVRSNVSGYEVIQTEILLTDFSFQDNTTFVQDDERLFVFSPLSKTNIPFFIITSDETYVQPSVDTDLNADDNSVTINDQDFDAEFDGLPETFEFKGLLRLSNFNLSYDDLPQQDESTAFTQNDLHAKYRWENAQLNHTTYVFANFSRLYSYVSLSDETRQHNVSVGFQLHAFTHFFVTDAEQGAIDYEDTTCIHTGTGYIDFYDVTAGISLIPSTNSNITFCPGSNNTLSVTMTIRVQNESSYALVVHEGDFTTTEDLLQPYEVTYGLEENITGLTVDNLLTLNTTNYDDLKEQWGYPNDLDFMFELQNLSGRGIVMYEPVLRPRDADIFARRQTVQIVDEYGLQQPHVLVIRGW